jgi:hypothetical protein
MEDFRRRILKVNENRIHKITNSIGVYDVFKAIRRNRWAGIGQSISEKQFYTIIRTINLYLAEQLSLGNDITLPHNMGMLEVRKSPVKYKMVDGRVVTNLPVDWDATLKLWAEDEEQMKKKTIVKSTFKELYRIKYTKAKAKYNNKVFYDFKVNRDIRIKLSRRIKKGLIDTYLAYEY